MFKFNPKHVKSGNYDVIITEGGISVMTNPGDFGASITPPEDTAKLSEQELQSIADQAVEEWEEFLEDMDRL